MNEADEQLRPRLQESFDGTTSTINLARETLRDWLEQHGIDPDLIGRAELVVSELASNAVQAAPGSPYILGARLGADTVVIRITNAPTTQQIPPPEQWGPDDVLAPRGRGLSIVAALSDSVDIDTEATGAVHVTASLRR